MIFEDVLMVFRKFSVLFKDVSLKFCLIKNICLNIFFISVVMDMVIEYKIVIVMARFGGIGIVYKNMDI